MSVQKEVKLETDESLSEKEKLYVENRLQGKSQAESYKLAYRPGDVEEKGHDRLNGTLVESRTHVQTYMERAKSLLRVKIVDSADGAFDRVEALSKFADSERVRLDANKTIIDLAEIKEAKAQFTEFNLFTLTTPDQVADAIRKAIMESAQKQLENNAIDVEFKEVVT